MESGRWVGGSVVGGLVDGSFNKTPKVELTKLSISKLYRMLYNLEKENKQSKTKNILDAIYWACCQSADGNLLSINLLSNKIVSFAVFVTCCSFSVSFVFSKVSVLFIINSKSQLVQYQPCSWCCVL